MSELEPLLKDYLHEAIIWRQLKHPNLLPCLGLYYLDNTRGRICLVSPWLENGNLAQFLRNPSQGSLNRPQLMYDIASGLSHLHALKIIHGDLKDFNILITSSYRACIADFGLSTVADSQVLSVTSSLRTGGTARWCAPEVHNGEPAKAESDIYSCGCLFYEIVTGLVPFNTLKRDPAIVMAVLRGERPSAPADVVNMSDDLWLLMNECWETEPGLRPTAYDLLRRLPTEGMIPADDWDETLFTELHKNVDVPRQPEEAISFVKRVVWERQLGKQGSSDEQLPDQGVMADGESLSLTGDLQGAVELFQAIWNNERAFIELVNQGGSIAQSLLDWLQQLVDAPGLSAKLRSGLCATLALLAQKSRLVPSSLIITGVSKLGIQPIVIEGGLGDMWKGHIEGLDGQVVCLKMPRRAYTASDRRALLKNYLREAMIWRQLAHPNILPCLGVHYPDKGRDRLSLVSPWMEYGNLVSFLNSHPRESVNHLQLMSILITPSLRACITSFGLARSVPEGPVSDFDDDDIEDYYLNVNDTPWLAPEVLRANANVGTVKSDIYACIFTGNFPFHDVENIELTILRGIRPTDPYDNSFSRMLWSLMNRGWDENPVSRPEAEDLLKSLVQLAQNADVDISPAEGWDSRLFNRTWNSVDHGQYLPSKEVSEFITTHE
ncbi:hypothetical protein VNI00_010938 [Paramarasmius palmivorus]|uniref:Protein kinase domain-containing protein n=1 Tax=Paramarasmius palmivorus TaxID=297713 RepID=A0AAW0CID5_9AGAR